MIKYQTFKIFFITLLIPLLFIKAQNCINYTGGIGEFETALPIANNFFYNNDNDQELTAGLFSFNFNNNPKLKIITSIDKKEKASGFGSQKIIISNEPSTLTTNPYVLMRIPAFDSNSIHDQTKNFYPKIGDIISSSIKIKTSATIKNIRYQIRVTARYYNPENINEFYHESLASFSTTSASTNWQTINFLIQIPSSSRPEYKKIDTLYQRVEFYFPSTTSSSTGIFWIDKLDFYIKRDNDCLKWPNPKQSSLKIFDLFALEKPLDFIYSYLHQKAHLNLYYTDLIVKDYDPSYKYFIYVNLTPLTRYFFSEKKGWAMKSNIGEFNNYLDEIKFIAHTGTCTSTMLYLHPNARYPEFLKINKNLANNYVVHGCLDEVYTGGMTNYTEPRLLDKYYEFITRFDSYFINPKLKYDAIFFDNLSTANEEISKQTPTNLDIKRNFIEFINYLNRKIAGQFKYFSNWGYLPYIDETNILHLRNYYLIKDYVDGYLDEGWLISPHDSSLNSYSPQNAQLIFKTVIENQNYDYILIVGAFQEDKCTSTDPKTMFMISSFYLVNNHNTYFALRPISPTTGRKGTYEKPQCFDSSFYLPLGQPLKINTIEEMIVTSTSNFTEGALYLRKYEKGLVLLNSSNNRTFQYQLQNNNQFSKYFDHHGNLYLTSTIINVNPRSGLILYTTEHSAE